MRRKRTVPGVRQLTLNIEPGAQVLNDSAPVPEVVGHPTSGAGNPVKGQERRPPEPVRAVPRKTKHYSLYDKVCTEDNLWRAWRQVEANAGAPGSDGQRVEQFAARARAELRRLRHELRTHAYRPRPVRRVAIPKPSGGTRPLGIPSVRDRIVQHALLQVLEPIFEAKFLPHSHGFRPGRGCQTALAEVDQAVSYGYDWMVDLDIAQFFDTVNHELVIDAVAEEIADGSVLRLIRAILTSGVQWPRIPEIEPTEQGTPQGGPLSPLLGNIYLHTLDATLRTQRIGWVRYADDVVLFVRSEQEAEAALAIVRQVLEGQLRLTVHPDKTRIVSLETGFDFLGFRYFRDQHGRVQKKIRQKSLTRFKEQVRLRTRRSAGQRLPKAKKMTLTRLQANQHLAALLESLSRYLRSWFGYFRDARTTWNPFKDLDGFVRRRLRCVIAKRYAKGRWHQILPNALLAQLGLFDLTSAYAHARNGHLTPLRDCANQA